MSNTFFYTLNFGAFSLCFVDGEELLLLMGHLPMGINTECDIDNRHQVSYCLDMTADVASV